MQTGLAGILIRFEALTARLWRNDHVGLDMRGGEGKTCFQGVEAGVCFTVGVGKYVASLGQRGSKVIQADGECGAGEVKIGADLGGG